MAKTVILGAARTPFGKMGGGLASLDATDLGGTAIAAALERAEVAPEQVEHVVFGQVLQAGQGQIPSRQAQIKGGIPKEVSSETVNKVCASGLRSAGMVDQAVRAGDLDLAVAGGMESMSNAPYLLKQARFGFRMGDGQALDAMVHDGLRNPFSGKGMGEEADEVAEELEITRPDMDQFALRSHERAVQATDEGRLPEEIVPVTVSSRKGDTTVEVDEAPRREGSLEALAKLRGAFHKDGAHTAGNAPGVNDGAGALVLSSDEWAKRNGREPLATLVAQAAVADDFPYLARTPANAAKKALEQAGLSVDDIDLFEINEAFASVALNSMRMLGVDESKVNVNGGAIALGHPIGASGARILHDAGERAAPPRRRAGLRGHLLRRRPGRRDDHRGQWGLRPLRAGEPPPSSTSTRRSSRARARVHFARAAYREGMLSRRQLAGDVWANVRFRLQGSTDEGTEELKQRILDAIAGQRVVDLARLGPHVLAGVLPLLYHQVLEEAYAHQDAGRRVYIVTAASQELAEVLAHVLVLDGGIGMRSEVKDGVYTGRADGPFTYREGKAEAIRELAAREGIDLEASYAYSDSESDLPMMRAVGHPVAVNPDAALERVARAEGWRIMRFDKLGRRLKVAGDPGRPGPGRRRQRLRGARLRRPRRFEPVSAAVEGPFTAAATVEWMARSLCRRQSRLRAPAPHTTRTRTAR